MINKSTLSFALTYTVLMFTAVTLCFLIAEKGAKALEKKNSPEKVRIFSVAQNKVITVDKIMKTDEEWQKMLTPAQYKVTTKQGTENPFTCELNEIKVDGIYRCVRCGTDLFKAGTKFHSGTGWPSFFEPISKLNVIEKPDNSLGMMRTEVVCARCGAHLGHVFNDGPAPTHKRYCINGVALRFVPLSAIKKN